MFYGEPAEPLPGLGPMTAEKLQKQLVEIDDQGSISPFAQAGSQSKHT
jgi:hypothetical protein